MDSLIDLMDGGEDFNDKVYDSTLDIGESCGCSMGEEAVRIQREARRRAFLIPVERTIFDWHLIEIDNCVANVKSADSLHAAFSALWEKDHTYEGDDFYICLDRKFIESMETDKPCLTSGYSKKADIIYGMKNGKSVPRHTIPVSELVPFYEPDPEVSSVYLFTPLHISNECFGYLVSKNFTKMVKDFYLNSLTSHIASGLGRARQNIRLENLNKLLADISVRDELTGLYNRMGYEKIVIPYLDELRSTKRNSVIMVVDINRMKSINDKYGHLQGDMAIKIVASAIKSSILKNWKAVRYGGDEYVIIGEYEVSEDMESIKQTIIDKTLRISQDLALPFMLSVSVGYVIIDPDADLRNEEYFRMADEAMYEMKQEAHSRERSNR